METQHETTPRNISFNVTMPWNCSLCSLHWQPVLFSQKASRWCQAPLEADAQTSYWSCPNIQRTSIYAATESNTQTQVLQMRTVRAAQFLVCFPTSPYHLFYFRGNLVWAKPRGDRTEGEIEQFLLRCCLTYEAFHMQERKTPPWIHFSRDPC